MSFSFEKFVQKSTRGLFAFIVVIMVVPLVLWGYMGRAGNEKDEDHSDAGIIFDTIHISKGEYNRRLQSASASYYAKKYNDPLTMMLMMRMGRRPEEPKAADLDRQAWEDIVLLREAKANGIDSSEREELEKLRDIFEQWAPRAQYSDELMGRISNELYGKTSLEVFKSWMHEHVIIEKLLKLISTSEFADYDRIYEQVMRGHQIAKVWYASFDPKDALREMKTPTTDEIAGYYQKNKDKFKVPGKVQVEYLMADLDELKKLEPEPTEEAIKAYYEANKKIEFAKPHEHKPGEKHEENETQEIKSFDEVKAEIPNKIKAKAAESKAAELMNKVDVALGAAATANNNAYPADIFDQLTKKFEKEKLVHDNTVSFDPKNVEDIEKVVGTNSNLPAWASDASTKVGDISQKVRTSKGVVLFRLSKRNESFDPGITERIRESIVKELQKEQVKKKTGQQANNVVQEITTHGMISARAKYPLDWRLTRYFRLGGGDTGIEDAQLGSAISRRAGGLKPGKAMMLAGTDTGNKDRVDWAYVIYLEDLVDVPPEDASSSFAGQRKSLDDDARKRYRDVYIQDLVKNANVKPDASLKKTDEKSSDSAPNP